MNERLFLRLDGDPLHGPEVRLPAGTLRTFPVAPALQAHVSHILWYRETIPDDHEVLERVVPDGAVRLVFNLGDPPSAGSGAGLQVEAVGASIAPALVRLRGNLDGLSVTLRPGAAAALLGLPAGEIAGSAVPLEHLWRGDAAEALRRIAEQPHTGARVELLQAILKRTLGSDDTSARSAAVRAATYMAASAGRRTVRDVARAIGVGERRLQQLFHAHVGLSPRAWSRLCRLHWCVRALRERREPRWAELAVQAGFYDQSHLANEFRAVCGLTPTEFMSSTSGSSKTPR